MKLFVAFAVVAIHLPFSALGVSGFDFMNGLVPEARDTVINGVGAIGKKQSYEVLEGGQTVTKTHWRVIAHAIYIGKTATGSALLVHTNELFDKDGNLKADQLKDLELRFGPTVSHRQVEGYTKRIFKKIPPDTEFIKHPEFVPQSKATEKGATHSIAIMILPSFLSRSLAPVPVVRERDNLTPGAKFLSFGQGNQYEKFAANVEDNEYVRDATSGFLRWYPVKKAPSLVEQSLLRMIPLAFEEQQLLYRVDGARAGANVRGPCNRGDLGSPLLKAGDRPDLKEGKVVMDVMLVGIHQQSVGTCAPAKEGVSPESHYINLKEKRYQEWLEKHVRDLERPTL